MRGPRWQLRLRTLLCAIAVVALLMGAVFQVRGMRRWSETCSRKAAYYAREERFENLSLDLLNLNVKMAHAAVESCRDRVDRATGPREQASALSAVAAERRRSYRL